MVKKTQQVFCECLKTIRHSKDVNRGIDCICFIGKKTIKAKTSIIQKVEKL